MSDKPCRPRRTPDPNELLKQIPNDARRRGYLPALPAFVIDYFGYFLGATGACIVPTWWAKALCCLLAGFSIGGLFIIGHDAGHSSFVPSRRINRWLGRLAFLPAYVPLATWRFNHNVLHHRYLRVRNHDMVWQPWSFDEYRSQSWLRRAYYRLLRTPLGLPLYWTIHNWVPRFLLAKREDLKKDWPQFQFDRVCIAAFVVAMYSLMYSVTGFVAAQGWSWTEPVGSVGVFAWVLVVPYVMWSCLMAFVDFIQHTHPRSVWFNSPEEWNYTTANLRSSTHILLPLNLNKVWHHILEHSAHHVDPRVPLYRLNRAQESLEQAYPDDVLVERLTPAYLWRLYRVCRLYDFERQQWLDYDGRPTAEAQRPLLEPRLHVLPIGPQLAPFPAGVAS